MKRPPKKFAGGGEIPKFNSQKEFTDYYRGQGYSPSPYGGNSFYNPKQYSYDSKSDQWGVIPGGGGNLAFNRPLSQHFVEYSAPSSGVDMSNPKSVNIDSGRKPVLNGNANYQSFQYPDQNGQYQNATTKHFDKVTGQEIDPAKSFDPTGKYVPYGLKNGGLIKKFFTGYAYGGPVDDPTQQSLTQEQIAAQNAQQGRNTQLTNSGISAGAQIAGLGGQYLQSQSLNSDGTVNVGQATGAGALKGAGKGASIGMLLGPEGAAVGAGLGAGIGAGVSYFGAKNLNDDIAYGKTQAENDKARNLQNQTYSTALAKQMADRQAGYSKGGEIKGKGGPKDDKIKAKVKSGSFIVPEENSEMAEEIREKVLKTPPKKKEADLDQKGGEEIRLSNGEHLFTPAEKKKITQHFGEEILEMLAPDAKDMDDDEYNEIEETHMAHGGELTPEKAHQMLKDGTANGHPLTSAQRRYFGYVYGSGKAEGGTVEIKPSHRGMFTAWAKEHRMSVAEAASHVMANKDKYSPHTVQMANFAHNFTGKCMGGMVKKYASGGDVTSYESPEEKKYKAAQKRYAELQQEESQLNSSKDKAAKTRLFDVRAERTALDKEFGFNNKPNNIPSKSGADIEKALGNGNTTSNSKVGINNTNRFVPSNLTDEEVTVPSAEKTKGSTIAADALDQSQSLNDSALKELKNQETVNKPRFTDAQKQDYLRKASNAVGQIGGLGNYFLPYKQYQLGQQYLAQSGPRPKGQIDPDFLKSVQTAQANAKFGMTPEEQSLINQSNISALRAGQNAAQNYSGGSSSTAYNLTRDAANQYYNRSLQSALANKNLQMAKQQYSDNLNLNKANMGRQLFEDNLAAFHQNQQAGSNLVSSALANAVAAGRLNRENAFQNKYAQGANPWSNYNI